MAISDYSTTPAANTTISGINIAENCPPSSINNAIRQMMADLAGAVFGAKTLSIFANAFSLLDQTDNTKIAKFSAAGGPTATTLTHTLPNTSGTLLNSSNVYSTIFTRDIRERNLLINGDFTINRRAFAGGGLAAGVYAYDMWKAGAGGCNIALSGTTVTLTGPILQILEAPNIAGLTYNVSVDTPSATIAVTISDGGANTVTGNITAGSGRRGVSLVVPALATGNVTVQLSGTAVTFSRVQMESGGITSVWDNRPKAQEIGLCNYYYETVRVIGNLYSTTIGMQSVTPISYSTKRTTPTLTAVTVDQNTNAATISADYSSISNARLIMTSTVALVGPQFYSATWSIDASL